MHTIRVDIEYDGLPFQGWQRQATGPTIQGVIEDILSRVEEKPVTLYGASRTDSGVHAEGQVAHFYTEANIPGHKWRDVLNYSLPPSVRVVESKKVEDSFHAQKDAVSKIYEYRILNRPFASALDRRVYYCPRELDWKMMREALPLFVGRHDFRAFQASGADVRTTVREILSFDLHEDYPGLFRFSIHGTGFLKQMVRNIMGTIVEIGEGKIEPSFVTSIIESGDRSLAGRTLPAEGLTLKRIFYA